MFRSLQIDVWGWCELGVNTKKFMSTTDIMNVLEFILKTQPSYQPIIFKINQHVNISAAEKVLQFKGRCHTEFLTAENLEQG